MPPRFGLSRSGFFFDKENGVIYKGVDSIKSIGEGIGDALYALKDNMYYSFTDLLYDIKSKVKILKKDQLDILIKLNFFEKYGNQNKLLYMVARFEKLAFRKTFRRDQIKDLGVTEDVIRKFADKETATRIEEIDAEKYFEDHPLERDFACQCKKKNGEWSTKKIAKKLGLDLQSPEMLQYATKIVMGGWSGIHNHDLLKYYEGICMAPPPEMYTVMKWQNDYLGYIDYTDPTQDKHVVYVMDFDDRYSPRFNAYCVKTGEVVPFKVHKKKYYKDQSIITAFADTPFADGDLLYLKKCKREPKSKLVDGEWTKDWSQMEWWVKDYKVIANRPTT